MFKKLFNSIMSAALVLTLLFSTGCENKQKTLKYDNNPKVNKIGSGVVTKNEKYALLWDEDRACILLKDISTGKVWSTTPYSYYTENSTDSFQDIICASPLIVKYLTHPDNSVKVLYGSSVFEKGSYSAKLINGGIKITYYFHTIEASIPVSYRLKDNYIETEINTNEIKEGSYPIYQIAVSPFISSVKNGTENGYLFVPSGSGAVIKTSDIGESRKYEEAVYGDDASVTLTEKANNTEQIHMPFFGLSDGESILTGIIDTGEEACTIAAQTGDSSIGYSSVYPIFSVRGYNQLRVNMVYAGATQKTSFYHDDLIDRVLKVRYYPSEIGATDITEMANTYRNYLQSNGSLKKRTENEKIYLQIVGGMMVDRILAGFPYKKFETSTTLEEAENIISDVYDRTKVNPVVQLKGFGKSGTDIEQLCGGFDIQSALGGWKNFEKLSNQENIFLDFDIFNYRKGLPGIKKAAQTANSENVYRYYYDIITGSQIEKNGRYKIISRSLIQKLSDKFNKTVVKHNLKGVSLGNAGYMTYSDYGDIKYYQKGSIVSDIGSFIKKTKVPVMTENANSYAAVTSTHILGSPNSSSKAVVFDYEVPMYQIVFKGFVSMSVQGGEYQTLDAVATGVALKYTVCDHFNTEFIGKNFDSIAFGVYRDISDKIESDYNSVKDCLESTKNATVKKYEILDNGVTKTTFDNGVVVYVNRSKVEQLCEFGMIPQHSFLFE